MEIINNKSSYFLATRLWQFLGNKRKRQLYTLLILMLASGFSELVTFAAVIPLLGVLTDENRLWENKLIRIYSEIARINNQQEMLITVTAVFSATVLASAVIRLTYLWVGGRLAAAIGSDISCEAYKRTLHQPYSVHLTRNSSTVISAICTHTNQTVLAINAALHMLTSIFIVICIFIGMMISDWKVASATTIIFGMAYYYIFSVTKRKLSKNSAIVAESEKHQLKVLQEGLGAIREVLLDGNQEMYLQIYRNTEYPMRTKTSQNTFLRDFPRIGLEAVGLLLIAFITLLVSLQEGGGTKAVTIVGALALGSQKLLPALQQTYGSWAVIKYTESAVANVVSMLDQHVKIRKVVKSKDFCALQENICLEKISFRYDYSSKWILKDVSLTINKGDYIGVKGSTGSGKSTLIDIIIGLLKPTKGEIKIDGQSLYDETECESLEELWRMNIAHVPQNIYLSDSTIAENIAFGHTKHDIDVEKLVESAKAAKIDGFINSLPEKYDTIVGERGTLLSGGQRQRIGIARAIYKKANVLILDEATSALDNETESEVIEAIENLSKSTTIIMIAHRLSTLARCNRIIEIKDGLLIMNKDIGRIT